LERRNLPRNDAHDDRKRSALLHHVHAEASDAGGGPRAIVVEQFVDARLVVLVGHEVQRDRARLFRRERLLGERHEIAVNARAKDVAGLDVQVRCAAVHRCLDDFFHAQYPARLSTRFSKRSPRKYRRQLPINRSSWRGQKRPGDTGDTCGVRRTCRRCQNGLVAASGSSRKTSSTAPRIRPASRSSARASSSIIAPRATLTTIVSGDRSCNRSRVNKPFVASVSGAARTTTLCFGSSASNSSSEMTRSKPGGGPNSTRRRTPVQCAPSAARRSPVAPPSPPTPTMRARTVSTSRNTESSATNGALFHSDRRC